MDTSSSKAKKNAQSAPNPMEVAREMVSGLPGQAAKDIADISTGIFEQLGLKPRRKLSGSIDVVSGKHVVNETTAHQFSGQQVKTEQAPLTQQNKEAIMRQFQAQKKEQTVVYSREVKEKEQKIESLLRELKTEVLRLKSQAADLGSDLDNISVATSPKEAGVYHENFFEWMIKEIKNIRRKVGQSRMWLQVAYQKKQKKGFWNMAKKHGNNFLMSGERTPAGGAG